MIAAVKLYPDVNEAVRTNKASVPLLIVSIIICGVVMGLVMSIYTKEWSRRFPWSYLLVFTFTTCESFVFAYMCSHYPTVNVLSSAGLTLLVTFVLSLAACITNTLDRRCFACIGYPLTLLVVVASVVTARYYIEFTEWWHPMVIGLCCALWGFFLTCDVPNIQDKYNVYYG